VCGKRQENGKVKSTENDNKLRDSECNKKRGDSPKVTCEMAAFYFIFKISAAEIIRGFPKWDGVFLFLF
jgi:hypothetical protein